MLHVPRHTQTTCVLDHSVYMVVAQTIDFEMEQKALIQRRAAVKAQVFTSTIGRSRSGKLQTVEYSTIRGVSKGCSLQQVTYILVHSSTQPAFRSATYPTLLASNMAFIANLLPFLLFRLFPALYTPRYHSILTSGAASVSNPNSTSRDLRSNTPFLPPICLSLGLWSGLIATRTLPVHLLFTTLLLLAKRSRS